jgi:hypothetical protein
MAVMKAGSRGANQLSSFFSCAAAHNLMKTSTAGIDDAN